MSPSAPWKINIYAIFMYLLCKPEQTTSLSTLGQQCDKDSERKNDSPNVSFIENCEDSASWPTVFGMTSKKMSACDFVIVHALGAIFSNQSTLPFLPVFQGVCPDFQGFCESFNRFCPDVQRFCPDFHQIKTWGGALAPPAPPPPTPLCYRVTPTS